MSNETQSKALERVAPKKITDKVMTRIQQLESDGMFQMPKNYSASNAMQSAWLVLQKTVDKNKAPVLKACTEASIANSLFDMAIQGLNPAKKQGYFIAWGKELSFMRSYFGTQTVIQRIGYYIDAITIWKGDKVVRKVDKGRYVVTEHDSPWENQGKEIAGVYAVVKRTEDDEIVWTEMMSWDQIQASWKKSKTYKFDNSVHREFPEDMAKRTCTERAAKNYVNTRDDSDILIGAYNKSTAEDYVEDVSYEDSEPISISLDEPESLDDHEGTEDTDPVIEIDEETGELKSQINKL